MDSLTTTVLESGAPYASQLYDELQKLYPFFESTVVLPTFGLDPVFEGLSESSGMDVKTLKYLVGLLAVYPFSFGFSKIQGADSLKHMISIFLGIWLQMFIFGHEWAHSLVSSFVAFILMKVLPAKSAPKAVFAWMMIYMSLSHIYRCYCDYLGWNLDFTGPQMILTQKLTSLAWNIYDGQSLDAEKKQLEGEKNEKTRTYKMKKLKARERYALKAAPSFLEFYGYVYCFSTILAGPAFEYKLYEEGITGEKLKKGSESTLSSSHILASLGCLLTSILHVVVYETCSKMVPFDRVYLGTDNFFAQPFYYRVGYSWLALLFVRQKYYFAWMIAEGAVIAAGFGFAGYDKEGKSLGWRDVKNVEALNFEIASSTSAASRAWNMRTQQWLERYVYIRNNNSLIFTYSMSAFWHGFYPGYYFFFLSVAIWTPIERAYLKLFQGILGDKSIVYTVFTALLTTATMNYFVMAFISLGLSRAITCYTSAYYWGHIFVAVMFVITKFVPAKKATDAKKKQ